MELFGFEAAVDVPAIIAILGLTTTFVSVLNIPKRFIPLIPVALGLIAGVFKALIGGGLEGVVWYEAIGLILWSGILYSGAASTIWKIKKRTIQDK